MSRTSVLQSKLPNPCGLSRHRGPPACLSLGQRPKVEGIPKIRGLPQLSPTPHSGNVPHLEASVIVEPEANIIKNLNILNFQGTGGGGFLDLQLEIFQKILHFTSQIFENFFGQSFSMSKNTKICAQATKALQHIECFNQKCFWVVKLDPKLQGIFKTK